MTDSYTDVALVWIEGGGADNGASLRIANALGGSQLWMRGTEPGLHIFGGEMREGAYDDEEMHVSGYFVLDVPFEDVGEVLQSAPVFPSELSSHSAQSVSASADGEPTILVVWTKIGAHTDLATDEVLGIVKAFNEWAQTLDERGLLLATDRLELFDNRLVTSDGVEETTYRSSSQDLRAIIPFQGDVEALAPTVAQIDRADLRVVIQSTNALCGKSVDPFLVVNGS